MSQVNNLSPQLLEEKRRRTRLYRILGICLVLLVPAGYATKLAYRAGKGWRARQLARQAEELMDKEQWEEAFAKARVAFQLKFEEPASLRIIARLYSATGRPSEALPFWKQLGEYQALTLADRRHRAEDLFRVGAVEEAEKENSELLAKEPDQPANLRLAARLALVKGKHELATEYARRAQQAEPALSEGKLLVALLEVESSDGLTRDTGYRSLLELGREQDKVGLNALTSLALRRDLPASEASAIIPLLRQHPLATENQRLMALDLEIGLQPSNRAAILDRMVAEYQSAEPARKRALAVWMNNHGEWLRTLAIVPLVQAIQRKDMLLVHLDALAALKRWEDIQKILGGKGVPLDTVYTELFLARSAMELGQGTIATLHWQRAHVAAAPSVEQMWFVGKYAENVGQMDRAKQAYESLKSNAKQARGACEALLRIATREGDKAEQRDLLREMHERWPKDLAVTNDHTYLSLLAGQDVVEGLKTARQLVADAPTSLPHRTTLALALLRNRDPQAALEVYAGLKVGWMSAPTSARAVHAAVLGQNGALDDARREAGALRIEDLRPEERELLLPWLPEGSPSVPPSRLGSAAGS